MIYALCSTCKGYTPNQENLAHHPKLGGKVGVRCTRCGSDWVYGFCLSGKAEAEYQRTSRASAEELAEKDKRALTAMGEGADGWQQFYLDRVEGLVPQPQYAKDEVVPTYEATDWEQRQWAQMRRWHSTQIAFTRGLKADFKEVC